MIKSIYLSLAAATALIAGVTQAANEYLIRIEGISGTSNIVGFEDYIPVGSWSLGFTLGVCQELHFNKNMDAASAKITEATLLGTLFPSVILVGLETGGDARPFTRIQLTLTNSTFTAFQTSSYIGSTDLGSESIGLQPSAVKYESFAQDATGRITLVATNTVTCQPPPPPPTRRSSQSDNSRP